jgi:Xaa-Pro aminopeptidase
MMKLNEPGVPDVEEWLAKQARNLPGPVGVDPTLVTISRAAEWAAALQEPLSLLKTNLVDAAWGASRPPLSAHPVKPHPLSLSGEASSSKLRRVAAALRDAGAGSLILNALDQIAWLFNLRGSDIECNPVFFSYAVVSLHGAGVSATLWLRRLEGVCAHLQREGCAASEEGDAPPATDPNSVPPPDTNNGMSVDSGTPANAEAVRVTLRPYYRFDSASASSACAEATGSRVVVLEGRTCTLACAAGIPEDRRRLVGASPVEKFKARKNGTERAGIVSSGQRDAAAIVSYLAWLEAQLKEGKQESLICNSADTLF